MTHLKSQKLALCLSNDNQISSIKQFLLSLSILPQHKLAATVYKTINIPTFLMSQKRPFKGKGAPIQSINDRQSRERCQKSSQKHYPSFYDNTWVLVHFTRVIYV